MMIAIRYFSIHTFHIGDVLKSYVLISCLSEYVFSHNTRRTFFIFSLISLVENLILTLVVLKWGNILEFSILIGTLFFFQSFSFFKLVSKNRVKTVEEISEIEFVVDDSWSESKMEKTAEEKPEPEVED